MYKKILFPTDFSRRAGHTLSHALTLTGVKSGEVIVQHVVADYFERLPHWTTIFDVHELQRHMDGYVADEMKRILDEASAPRLRVRPMVSKGRPVEEIRAASEEEMVDLIVMASSTGAITSRVIEKGSRPVLAVLGEATGGTACGKVRRILAAVDFSHRSQMLVDHAFRLHAWLGADVYMLHVIEATCAMEAALRESSFSSSLNRLREWALNQLDNLTPTEFVRAPGIHRMVHVGRPSEAIPQVGREIQADLIVVGIQDHGQIQQRLIGSSANPLDQVGATILALPA